MLQTRFTLVRHGETEWNILGKEMGQLDSPLTPTGVNQGKALGQRLANVHFDAFYSSDLGRASATSMLLAENLSLPIVYEPRLRERHTGIFQGHTIAEIRNKFPKERADYERIGFEYIIPGGESAKQRLERTLTCLEELATRHQGGSVLAVTHGGILTGFFQHVLGISPESPVRFRRLNAAINVFNYGNGKWVLETWGDVEHLSGVRSLDDPTGAAFKSGH
jgi:broad specificity phosphatase PhoE